MGCLYRVDFPSGKSYIGITAGTAERRFSAHVCLAMKGARGCMPMALRKYGADAAQVSTLVIADDWKYLCELERRAIAAYETRTPNGYNMTDGGDGAPKGHSYRVGLKHSDEAKAKMSAAAKGRKVSEATKAKISAASTGNKFNLGRKASSETRVRQSLAQTGVGKGSTSGHVGVSWHKGCGRWRAHITKSGRFIDLGYHSTIEEAVLARKAGELELKAVL